MKHGIHSRRIAISLLSLVLTLSAFSQSIVLGNVQDAFLKTPLPEAKVSLLLASDSTVVVDSIPLVKIHRSDGTLSRVQFSLQTEKKTCNYLLRASLDGYEDGWQPLAIDGNDGGAWLLDEPLELRKLNNINLNEVTVTATKVKMYYKGDTLVYNADAFNLPDGSMLDALIRQLPGVTMDDSGQIFVNGRKIDELLLGSRSFMRGNTKVLMENLPYYTVKDIKVYDKRSDMSEALGYDVDARRYVMDVNLKEEYRIGYIANMEVAGGTEERWLGRGFLLGFTKRWRYSLQGNMNNVNETGHISGNGYWTPAAMPKSLITTHGVAANLNYHSEEKKLTNDLTANVMSFDTESEMRQHCEQFLAGSKPASQTENRNKSDNMQVVLANELLVLKPSYLQLVSRLNYEKRDASGLSQFKQWDDGLTAAMRTDALSEGRSWSFFQQAIAAFGKNKWYTNIMFFLTHNDDQSWLSERYDSWQASSPGNTVRHNARDVYNRKTDMSLSNLWKFPELLGRVGLVVSDGVRYYNKKAHDYLYHPDTLLLASQLDVLKAITDPSNSYDSHQLEWENTASVSFFQSATYGYVIYTRWEAGLDVRTLHRKLDYQRGAIDTLMRNTDVYLKPHFTYEYVSPDTKHKFKFGISHRCSPAGMVDMIAYRDDSNPLVVKEGNSGLKGQSSTNATAGYTKSFGKHASQWHVGAELNYNHRDVSQSVNYNPLTGVFTYKPVNVNGAYFMSTQFDVSSHIGEKRYWSWQMKADANYIHSLDHSMLAGESESRVNAVNTLTLHDAAYLQYNKGSLNIRAKGDVKWRHSEGKMRDFETLNVTDFQYGLSARYTIPVLKTTFSAEGNMYSRRGYGSSALNTDDFVLNVSISQPFLKGKLIARIEAFDLMHQLSSTQYEVNAQGRTETWYRSLPHYVMAHLVYHFNKNPKK